MGKEDETEEIAVVVEDEIEVREPSMYRVILLNDNYTTMEFVVYILQEVFRKSAHEAQSIMLSVHTNGSAVAGVYTKEVAETKVLLVTNIARQNEFPLKCVIEPDE